MARNRRGKGEGSIYQRADRYWVGSCEAGYRWSEAKGKLVRRQARVVRKTRASAVAGLDELRAQVAAGCVPDRTRTVAQYLTWWLDNVAKGSVAESTYGTYRSQVANLVKFIGRVKLGALRKSHVVAMMANMAAAGLGDASRAACLTRLRQALRFAYEDGAIVRNVAEGVTAPAYEPKTDDTPTVEESEAILAAAEGDRLQLLAWLNLKYGNRQAELLNLRWEDVGEDAYEVIEGKTNAAKRTIPQTPEATAKFDAHRRHQAAERLAAGSDWVESGYVFVDARGHKLDGRKVRAWWHALCERAGVKRCRFHAGRHAAATLLFAAGIPIEIVSKILGHSDVAVTRKVYLRVRDDLVRRGLLQVAA
jgi:integrase